MAAFRTRIITRLEEVPPGFVRIAQLAESQIERVWLSRAHLSGEIQAVKMNVYADHSGPVFVNEEQARSILERRRAGATRRSLSPVLPSMPEPPQPESSMLPELLRAIRDLQAAVELLTERLPREVPADPA